MTNVTTILAPTATKGPVGPTILGSELRRKTAAVVNGLSHGVFIEVKFLGTRAYTNGRRIVLPKIKDLAEIKYATARALTGYAIHEVAHIRYTDFKAIERIFEDKTIVDAFCTDDKAEIVQRLKLIKKFENCIEDYRIEREMTRRYPGTKTDLEALRVAIHPRLKTLTTGWFADPRSCGPLALTWLGARINGFANQHLQQTLDHVPAPVMDLIEDWTERMTGVQSTAETVELAIVFEMEAQAFAKATRDAADQAQGLVDEKAPDGRKDGETAPDEGVEKPVSETPDHSETSEASDASEQDDLEQTDLPTEEEADRADAGPAADDSDKDADVPEGSTPSDVDGDADDGQAEGDGEGDDLEVRSGDDEDGRPSDDAVDGETDQDDSGSGPQDDRGQAGRTEDEAPRPQDATPQDGTSDDASDAPSDGAPKDATNPGSEPAPFDGQDDPASNGDDFKFGSDRREKQDAAREVEREGAPQPGDRKRPAKDGEEGQVDLNGELLDDYQDPKDAEPEAVDGQDGGPEEDPVDRIESDDDREGDAPREGPSNEPDALPETGGADDGIGGGADGGAFDDVLEDDARRDDAISDMIEEIQDRIDSGQPLPEFTPDASDGEVDPSSLLDEISESNEDAPDYDSCGSDPDPNDRPEEETRSNRSLQHYGDARFQNAPKWSEEGCRHAEMQQKAAGAISTTARTIKRLLMAQEKSGFLANRRSGDFDIRNVSAIARNTGTCYRRSWTKPAPKTLLVTLVDFSGSMDGDDEQNRDLESPIAIAMTGALAIEQAVKGTSVNSAMYGFTGASPTVNMTVFKEGRQSEILTRRRIGAFEKIDKRYTPTGEAMAAVAARMDNAEEERRILLVLTDGMADDMQLCADVTAVLIRRGIEVVVIGVQDDSAESWAPVHKTIMNLGELPAALLSTIDPRANRKGKRRLAA